MRKLTLTADHETLVGYLPDSWAEVPIQPFAELAATAQDLPEGVPAAHLFTHRAGCEALARLLALPTAAPLLADMSLLRPICEAAPWLFLGPLPEANGLAERFTHQGLTYVHSGLLDDTTGGQLEALLGFLQASGGNALACAPHLLAVLYQPVGQELTAQVVATSAAALATLPMSLGWPAIANFLLRFTPLAMLTQKHLAAQHTAEQALSALETAATCPTSAPRGFSLSMRRWLVRHWIRLVRKQLATSSPPSATTAGPASFPGKLHLRAN